MSGAYLALCVLAGLGAAAILRSLPARAALPAALVGIALVAFAANPSARSFGLVDARPSPQVTAFFEELERLGNTGPLLELPLFVEPMRRRVEANRMLAAAWHQRRTSSCVTSHLPPGYEEVALLARALPARRALAELERLGFTTLVVHRDTAGGVGVDSAFWRASRRGAPLLRLFATPSLAAYAIAFEDEAGRRVEPDVIRRYKLTLFGKRAVAVAGPEK